MVEMGRSKRVTTSIWSVLVASFSLLAGCKANTQTIGIHLRHSQGHEVIDGQEIPQGADRNHSHSLSHIHSIDLPSSAEDGTLSCSQVASLDRMVLAAGERYNLTWLSDLRLPYIQYQSSDPLKAHYFVDNANEAGAYLRFIHDYYNCLPEAVAFIHGHGDPGWHSDNMTEVFQNINWESLPNYIDINKNINDTIHVLGDLKARPDNPVASGPDVYNGQYNLHQIMGGVAYESWSTHLWLMDQSYARAFDKHFGPAGLGEMPGKIRITCCAQFIVKREAIRLRPRSFYKRTIEWLKDNDIRGNNIQPAKYVIGDVLSVYWSMIFGAADIIPMKACEHYSQWDRPARCANA